VAREPIIFEPSGVTPVEGRLAAFQTPRDGALVATCFILLAIALSGVRPLWLDEILQLLMTSHTSVAQMIRELPQNSGASPLGYLIQQATLQITGYSLTYARLPEILFGGGSVFVVALLAGQLGFRSPWVSASMFALFPLTLRYATESRVYAPALFFSVLATYLYVRLTKSPTGWLAAWYALALTAAVYTHPYAASVGLVHVVWSITEKDRKSAFLGGTGLAGAAIAYLPWFLWSKSIWIAGIGQQKFGVSFSSKTPLMIFREMLGAGYWGSGLLLILCAFCFKERALGRSSSNLIGFLIVIPILSGLAIDAWFSYFIAARQFLWILPAVALIGTAAVETRRMGAFIAAGLFVSVCILQSYKYFVSPREDWHAAAVLANQEAGSDGCFISVPLDQLKLYAFFVPELKAKGCKPQTSRVVLALSPYATHDDLDLAIDQLILRGYSIQREATVGKSSIVSLVRP